MDHGDSSVIEKMRARVVFLRSSLPQVMAEIEKTLARFDPLDVLAVGFARYALKDPESFEEPEHFAMTPLEHVAVLYARNPGVGTEPLDFQVITELFDTLDEITIMWLALHPEFDGPKGADRLTSLRARIMMHETMVRMVAFAHQIEETALALFTPFSEWMRSTLGFTIEDAFKIVHGIEQRNEVVFNVSLQTVISQLKGASSKGDHLQRLLAKAISPVLAFSAEEIASKCEVSAETVKAFLAFFCIGSSDIPPTYILPSPALPLRTKPLMSIGDKYIVPSASLLDVAIQPAIEHALNPAAGHAHPAATEARWQTYVLHRKEFSEKRALELLSRALPQANTYRDLKYRLDGREYDLDGLVLFERTLVLVEVKAGNFSVQARFGDSEALVGDIQKLIDHPHEQGERAQRFLSTSTEPRFRLADKAVVTLEPTAYDRTILITVTLDDLGQLTSAYNQLPVPTRNTTPWAVSIHDLEVIVDHVGTAAEFLQYIDRRIALTNSPSVVTFDELEWLGRYLSDSLDGLDFPPPASGSDGPIITGNTVDLNSYYLYKTGVRHIPVEKPIHRLPEIIRLLLDEMQAGSAEGWLVYAIALLELTPDTKVAIDRKVRTAIERGLSTAFVCRSAMQNIDVWVKLGDETVLVVEPRHGIRQLILELTSDGSLISAAWAGAETRLIFAAKLKPVHEAIPLPPMKR